MAAVVAAAKMWKNQNIVGHSLLNVPILCYDTLSVIGQKGKSQNGCFKKTKHTKFFEKLTFLTL